MTCYLTVWFFYSCKSWPLLVICVCYITNRLAQVVSVQDWPGQMQEIPVGFIRKLHADVSDANPHFLQHWKGSWTAGEDNHRGGKSPSSYSSISVFPLCVNKSSRTTFVYGSLFVFFHGQNSLTSIYLHGPQHSREMGVSLMNYLPSTAARHQSAINHLSHLHLCLRDKKVRYTESQWFVICPRSSRQRNWGTVCAWPEAAQQLHSQWSSTDVLAPAALVKAASDGCFSSF